MIDVGKPPGGRLGRVCLGSWRILRRVRDLRPQVVHFHDPELIPAGFLLKLLGTKVVYDVHEDVPRQLMDKFWLPRPVRKPVALATEVVEWLAGAAFDGIVSATPLIADRFPADKTIVAQNFPVLEELATPDAPPYSQRRPTFVYVGRIGETRGAREMVSALERVAPAHDVTLELAGSFGKAALEPELRAMDGWKRVKFHGWASRTQVARLLGQARAGLVTLHPTPAYWDSYPVKMFEYMAAGLPVIASDFPLWRSILDEVKCGLLVDARDPSAIAKAMSWILDHPDEAEAMGLRGRQAVEQSYNWGKEADKLLGFYRRLVRTVPE